MQLTTLRRQLLTVNAKLAAASNTLWGAQEQLSSLQNELKEVNIRMEAAQAEIDHLHSQCTLLNAAKGAAEAHCMLCMLEAEDLRKQLDETKRKSKRPWLHNSLGRFLILPQAQVAFETQQEQRATQLAAEAAKQADKQAAEHMRELQRADNALHKTFTSPLASYIRKDDLKDIATALTLDQTGPSLNCRQGARSILPTTQNSRATLALEASLLCVVLVILIFMGDKLLYCLMTLTLLLFLSPILPCLYLSPLLLCLYLPPLLSCLYFPFLHLTQTRSLHSTCHHFLTLRYMLVF